jgi:hypothetical protein
MKNTLYVMGFVALLSVPVMATDLLGGINKAAEKANAATSQTQAAAAKVQAATTSAQTVQQGASAEQMLTDALQARLQPGVTNKNQLIQMLGQPVETKTTGKTQVWQYKAAAVAEKLANAQAIANAVGVQTPDVSGMVQVVLEGDLLKSYSLLAGK